MRTGVLAVLTHRRTLPAADSRTERGDPADADTADAALENELASFAALHAQLPGQLDLTELTELTDTSADEQDRA